MEGQKVRIPASVLEGVEDQVLGFGQLSEFFGLIYGGRYWLIDEDWWKSASENVDGKAIGTRSTHTMLSRLQRLLRKLVVSLVGSSDYDQLDVLVVQGVVQSGVDGSGDAEPLLEFTPLALWTPLQNGVQGEEFWKSEDEGYVEGETGQTSSQDTSADGFHVDDR